MMLSRRSLLLSLASAPLAAMGLSACNSCRPSSAQEVVVYTSVDQVFSEPVFRAFEAESGVRVRAVYDTEETKSTGVLNRLIAEAQNPQADVFWSGDPVRPFQLVRRNLVEPLRLAPGRRAPGERARSRWDLDGLRGPRPRAARQPSARPGRRDAAEHPRPDEPALERAGNHRQPALRDDDDARGCAVRGLGRGAHARIPASAAGERRAHREQQRRGEAPRRGRRGGLRPHGHGRRERGAPRGRERRGGLPRPG
jgi:hypothetical protein